MYWNGCVYEIDGRHRYAIIGFKVGRWNEILSKFPTCTQSPIHVHISWSRILMDSTSKEPSARVKKIHIYTSRDQICRQPHHVPRKASLYYFISNVCMWLPWAQAHLAASCSINRFNMTSHVKTTTNHNIKYKERVENDNHLSMILSILVIATLIIGTIALWAHIFRCTEGVPQREFTYRNIHRRRYRCSLYRYSLHSNALAGPVMSVY